MSANRFTPRVEQLEERCCPTGTITPMVAFEFGQSLAAQGQPVPSLPVGQPVASALPALTPWQGLVLQADAQGTPDYLQPPRPPSNQLSTPFTFDQGSRDAIAASVGAMSFTPSQTAELMAKSNAAMDQAAANVAAHPELLQQPQAALDQVAAAIAQSDADMQSLAASVGVYLLENGRLP